MPGQTSKLRVAFLAGGDSPSTRRSVEAVCQLPGVEPAAVLLDTAVLPLHRRFKILFRNIRANGWSYYPVFRILQALRAVTTAAVNQAAVRPAAVSKLLKQAFPDTCFSLAELGVKYGMPVHAVGNINSPEAIRVLSECRADLGIVLGTRILKPPTFTVPRLGSINLHKGKVPEYRGLPPGFWELFDGAPSAGVTVHFVDKGLDTGDIAATGTVPILKTETPASLLEKLHAEGARVLAAAVSLIRDGHTVWQPQEKLSVKPRSKPTRQDVALLHRKLPHWKKTGDLSTILRDLYLLLVYYSGVYWLVRQSRRLNRSRGAIFLHHRVNDYSQDVLTVDTRTFAAQLLAIAQRYPFSSTANIVASLSSQNPLPPTTIAIHFDDCYRDILTHGAPILKALGIPACAFINSGFIDTERSFAHDLAKYPFHFPLLRSADVQAWRSLGFEVGAHTVNHVDLGVCPAQEAQYEIAECGRALQEITGQPIQLFSFPFGRPGNINPPNRRIVETSGYTALFSAYGGFIGPRTDRYNIPRLGASHESSPLYCLLQIEGLTLSQLAAR